MKKTVAFKSHQPDHDGRHVYNQLFPDHSLPPKPNIGFQMPGYQIFKNEDLRSRSLQEVRLYYPINEKTICCFSTCMEKAKALK